MDGNEVGNGGLRRGWQELVQKVELHTDLWQDDGHIDLLPSSLDLLHFGFISEVSSSMDGISAQPRFLFIVKGEVPITEQHSHSTCTI